MEKQKFNRGKFWRFNSRRTKNKIDYNIENNPEPELNPTRWDPDEVEEIDPQEDELEFQSDSDSESEW